MSHPPSRAKLAFAQSLRRSLAQAEQSKKLNQPVSTADRVLWRWTLNEPRLDHEQGCKVSATLFDLTWAWASEGQAGLIKQSATGRWLRFLRLMRSRARAYKRSGYKGDCTRKAVCDIGSAVGLSGGLNS